MRVAVVGAGAIGAYVGAALVRAGADVTLVARGAHGTAMRANGVRVHGADGGDFTVRPAVTDDIVTIGRVDVAVLALKAHQIASVVERIPTLFDEHTTVIGIQNGLPWWYFANVEGAGRGIVLESVDPGGRIAAAIAPARAIGCVAYAASEIESPGVVRHIGLSQFVLGEPDGTASERLNAIAAAFDAGGLEAPTTTDIRAEIWLKLLGNVSFNPISALTRATLVDMANDRLVADVAREMMEECARVVARLGVRLSATVEERLDRARRVGAHKTSMLQDLEAGRTMEIEALVGSIVELGRLLAVDVPATRHVYALVRLLARSATAGAVKTSVSI